MDVQSLTEPKWMPHGICVYVGTTGSGKTYLAWKHLKRLRRRARVPCLLIDSAGAENFQGEPHAKGLAEVAAQLNDPNKGIVYWTPENVLEVDALFSVLLRLAKEGKATPIGIMIDEVSFWTVESRSKELRKLCRLWRHVKVTLLITSQHVSGDLGQVMLACNPLLFLFKTTAPASLKWIEDNHAVTAEEVRAIPERSWVEVRF